MRPGFCSLASRPMSQEQTRALRPTPGILVAKPRRARKHPRTAEYVVSALLLVTGIGLAAWAALSGFPYVIRLWRIIELPAAVGFVGIALLGVVGMVTTARKPLAPWYQPWSLVEFADEPEGLRVFAGRSGSAGFLVRPDEVLRIDAAPRRQGATKVYDLVVSAPAGEHSMPIGSRLRHLTMVPLVEAARARGIDVVRYGDAGLMTHPAPLGE